MSVTGSEPHTCSVPMNEPHSGNSDVSEPHTCSVTVNEAHSGNSDASVPP